MATKTGPLPIHSESDFEPEPVITPLREASKVVDALSSETARMTLTVLTEEPMPVSGVAETIGTSLQNATYHTNNLLDAGLLEIVDTWYSAKGREMNVYASKCNRLVFTVAESPTPPPAND